MPTVYLAMKHQQHPYSRGNHLAAGTVEEAFDSKKAAEDFVAEKNKRATYNLWSVKAKKVKCAVRYGCHCDLEPGMKPDGCVLDEDRAFDCVNAQRLVQEGKRREDCHEWKQVTIS